MESQYHKSMLISYFDHSITEVETVKGLQQYCIDFQLKEEMKAMKEKIHAETMSDLQELHALEYREDQASSLSLINNAYKNDTESRDKRRAEIREHNYLATSDSRLRYSYSFLQFLCYCSF